MPLLQACSEPLTDYLKGDPAEGISQSYWINFAGQLFSGSQQRHATTRAQISRNLFSSLHQQIDFICGGTFHFLSLNYMLNTIN